MEGALHVVARYIPASIPQQDVIYLFRAKSVAYVNNASFAWLVWDWMILAEDEWNLIWRKKLSVASGLYIALRLFSFSFQAFGIISMVRRWTDFSFCKGFWWSITIGTFVQVLIVQLILQGRVYAIYGRDRRVLFGNAILFLLSFIGVGIVFARELPTIHPIPVPKPILGCWAGMPKAISQAFIGPCIFEAWLWVMVCYKAYQHASAYARTERKSIRSGETLMFLLVRDSFLWFSAAAVLMVSNIIAFAVAGNGYNYLGIPLFHSAACVGGCRLILNVRKAYFAEHDRTTHNAIADESFRAAPMPTSQMDPMESYLPETHSMEMAGRSSSSGAMYEKAVHDEEKGGVAAITVNQSDPTFDEDLDIRARDVEEQWTSRTVIEVRTAGECSGSGSQPSSPTDSRSTKS